MHDNFLSKRGVRFTHSISNRLSNLSKSPKGIFGSCAVTGIAIPELLRASHAKPWAKCDTDHERLNVFNGFLLCAHLDALFDQGLMTFDDQGTPIYSTKLDTETRFKLSLGPDLKLRWITAQHTPFLSWHRQHVFCQQ